MESFNDNFQETILPVVVCFIIYNVIGFVGNLTVLFVYGYRYPRNRFRSQVLALAVVDFTSCCTTVPMETVSTWFWFASPTRGLCKAKNFFVQFTGLSAMYMLFVTAVCKYRQICKPFGRQLNIKWILILSSCGIFGSFLCATPAAILWDINNYTVTLNNYSETVRVCEVSSEFHDLRYPELYRHLLSAYDVFLLAAIVLYILVARETVLHVRKIRKMQKSPGGMYISTACSFTSSSKVMYIANGAGLASDNSNICNVNGNNKGEDMCNVSNNRSDNSKCNGNSNDICKSNVNNNSNDKSNASRNDDCKRQVNGNSNDICKSNVNNNSNDKSNASRNDDCKRQVNGNSNDICKCNVNNNTNDKSSDNSNDDYKRKVKDNSNDNCTCCKRKVNDNKTDTAGNIEEIEITVTRRNLILRQASPINVRKVLIMVIIAATFSITFLMALTFGYVFAMRNYGDYESTTELVVLFVCYRFYFINYAMNSVVYFALDPCFRGEVLKIFGC